MNLETNKSSETKIKQFATKQDALAKLQEGKQMFAEMIETQLHLKDELEKSIEQTQDLLNSENGWLSLDLKLDEYETRWKSLVKDVNIWLNHFYPDRDDLFLTDVQSLIDKPSVVLTVQTKNLNPKLQTDGYTWFVKFRTFKSGLPNDISYFQLTAQLCPYLPAAANETNQMFVNFLIFTQKIERMTCVAGRIVF